MPHIKERRRRQRIDVALPIKIKYNREKILTKTKNISILGTYIETDKEIPPGSTLDIKIRIPKTGPAKTGKAKEIGCAGITFRCQPTGSPEPKNPYGIGIFFRSFLESGEKDLSNYIDYVLLQEKKIGKIYMRKRKRRQLKRNAK